MDISILPLSLTRLQLYGLVFLMGGFSVATLSDLRRMSAQKEFMEIWILFFFSFLIYDLYMGYTLGADWILYAKWLLIVLFFIIWASDRFFKTAVADVCACLAVMVLLTPLFILLFLLGLKIFDLLLRSTLKKGFGKNNSYPFMPVITPSTASVFIIGFYILDWV